MSTTKETYEKRRIESFLSLGTNNKEWEHAKVKDFVYSEKYDKKGELIEEWLPVYDIPVGFKNPYEEDVLTSETKKCQLCQHPIIYYGIILHREKNLFLVVGLDCYELYESDNDKKLKLELLCKLQSGWWEEKIREERDKIVDCIKKQENHNFYRELIPENLLYYTKEIKKYSIYKAYWTITRSEWLRYSPIKFKNFIAKNAYFFNSIGYVPPKIFGAKFNKEYNRNLAVLKRYIECLNFFKHLYAEKTKKSYFSGYCLNYIVNKENKKAFDILKESFQELTSKKVSMEKINTAINYQSDYGNIDDYKYISQCYV
jgi:hypothetical protein